MSKEERAENVTLWAAFSLSYLHAVQPGVSICCADAEWRDLTFTAFSLSFFCYDPNQSTAILYIICGKVGLCSATF